MDSMIFGDYSVVPSLDSAPFDQLLPQYELALQGSQAPSQYLEDAPIFVATVAAEQVLDIVAGDIEAFLTQPPYPGNWILFENWEQVYTFASAPTGMPYERFDGKIWVRTLEDWEVYGPGGGGYSTVDSNQAFLEALRRWSDFNEGASKKSQFLLDTKNTIAKTEYWLAEFKSEVVAGKTGSYGDGKASLFHQAAWFELDPAGRPVPPAPPGYLGKSDASTGSGPLSWVEREAQNRIDTGGTSSSIGGWLSDQWDDWPLEDLIDNAAMDATFRAIGRQGEESVGEYLKAKGWTLLGAQVYVETAAGTRILDFLAISPGGVEMGLEVKVNTSTRSSSQERKDFLIREYGGRVRSYDAPPGYEYNSSIQVPVGIVHVTITRQ